MPKSTASFGVPVIDFPIAPLDPIDAIGDIRAMLAEQEQDRADEARIEQIAEEYFYQRGVEM